MEGGREEGSSRMHKWDEAEHGRRGEEDRHCCLPNSREISLGAVG